MGSGTETTFSMNPETGAAQREEWWGQEPVEMLGLEHPCLGLCGVMRAEGLHGLSSVRWAGCRTWWHLPFAGHGQSWASLPPCTSCLCFTHPQEFMLEDSPQHLPDEFRCIWFCCLAGKQPGTPAEADMWLCGLVCPGDAIDGPFPNPGCPPVPKNRRRAVLPKRDLFLLGCLAQGPLSVGGWEGGGVCFRLSCYLSDTYQASKSRRPNFSISTC